MAQYVTTQQVKEAVEKAGLTRIDHHDCGGCGYMTAYLVRDGQLYFDHGCDCGRGGYNVRPADWSEAAEYINMQTRNWNGKDIAAQVAKGFGIDLPPESAAVA